ncbi:MAG: hypothetical protein DHS20C14_22850 [Phycisphaeraceae bacterium]|nr:MAG: hypothetical protein DHS20C14_22850 [Phycisphaeraceae bacterium]
MPTKPTTVKAYLDALPEDRRKALSAVRATIRKNLPKGYAEGIQYGMIGYFVPHSIYPPGYHCDPKQPLPFASLASQKNHMGLYMFCLYNDKGAQDKFARDWKAAAGKLDMGKSCVRFKKLEDVPLDVVGRAIKAMPAKKFVAQYEANLEASGMTHLGKKATTTAGARKKTAKKTAKKVSKKPAAKKVAKKPAAKKAPRRAR